MYFVTKVIGWIIQILYYVDISCNGAKMYPVIVIDSIKGSPDVVDIGVFCCLFVVCIYKFGWLCRATYCSVVSTSMLGVSHAVQNEKKLLKFTQSDSVYTLEYIFWLVIPSYLLFCCIYFDAWCIACCSKREETLEVYTVIREVLLVVLGLLVCKIQ